MMMPFEWDVRVFLEGSHGGRIYVGNDRRGHHGLHHYAGLNWCRGPDVVDHVGGSGVGLPGELHMRGVVAEGAAMLLPVLRAVRCWSVGSPRKSMCTGAGVAGKDARFGSARSAKTSASVGRADLSGIRLQHPYCAKQQRCATGVSG